MEWEKQQQHQPQQHSHPPTLVDGGDGLGVGVGAAAMYVKVMTDEQLEVLRTQIAVYATICEQLVDMHKAVTAQQDLADQSAFVSQSKKGVRLGNPYCDPLVASIGHKITARQRWTPTPIQLQKLEQIFDQGTGTPSKQKIKDITSELSQYGQISETNVYNWFQNRRARSKRKQLNNAATNGGENEVDVADAESPKEKKTKPQNFQPLQDNLALGAEDPSSYLQSSGMDSVGPQSNKVEPVFLSDGNVKPSPNSGHLSFLESMLETQRIDHFIGKMEITPNYDPYHSGEDYGMTG